MNILILILVLCGEPTSILVSEGDTVTMYQHSLQNAKAIYTKYKGLPVRAVRIPLDKTLSGTCT